MEDPKATQENLQPPSKENNLSIISLERELFIFCFVMVDQYFFLALLDPLESGDQPGFGYATLVPTILVHIGCSEIVVDCAPARVVDPHRFRCGSDVDPDPDPGQTLNSPKVDFFFYMKNKIKEGVPRRLFITALQ